MLERSTGRQLNSVLKPVGLQYHQMSRKSFKRVSLRFSAMSIWFSKSWEIKYEKQDVFMEHDSPLERVIGGSE